MQSNQMNYFLMLYIVPLVCSLTYAIVAGRKKDNINKITYRDIAKESFIPAWNWLILIGVIIELIPTVYVYVEDSVDKFFEWIIPDKK